MPLKEVGVEADFESPSSNGHGKTQSMNTTSKPTKDWEIVAAVIGVVLIIAICVIFMFWKGRPPAAAASGPVGAWSGDGNATDSAGGNDGILENVTYTQGIGGQAFYLNGSNADVKILDSPALKPTNVTVVAWVKLDDLASPVAAYPGLQYIVFKKNSRGGNFEAYELEKNRLDGEDMFRFQVTSADGEQVPARAAVVPEPGVWYHLAGTYDGETVKIYVNGALNGSAEAGFPIDYGTRPLFIGTSGEGWDGRVQGAVGKVAVYDRALSASEIADIYNRQKPQ